MSNRTHVSSWAFAAISHLKRATASTLAVLALIAPAMVAPCALLATVAFPAPAEATGGGWCAFSAGSGTCFSSPLQAAYATFQDFTSGLGTFEGYVLTGPGTATAYWNYFGPGSSLFYYYCPSSFQRSYGSCPSGPPIPTNCDCDENANNGGDPAPRSTHPIDLLSGNKQLVVTDFANSNRSLVLTRFFNSAAQTSQTSWRAGVTAPVVASPIGLGNWLYDFQFELQIVPGSGQASPVLLMAPNGSAPAFIQQSASSLILGSYTTGGYPNPQTDYTLSIVGYTPSGGSLTPGWPSSLTAQSTTWTLTDGADTIYTLTTLLDPNTNAWDIARPTKIAWRDGKTWTLSYGAKSDELDQVTDIYGNVLTFTWSYNPTNNAPAAIQSVTLPGSYSLKYSYSTLGAMTGGFSSPDIMTEVEYLDNHSTIQDSTTYQYNNSSCPYSVTGVFDNASVQRWGVTYNGSCQATVSSVTGAAGGIESYQVSYTPVAPPGNSFTSTMTNPLGKVSVYTFYNNSGANQGLQLTGVVNQASPLSPASSKTYTYGSNGFVASITDENGNLETLTRDLRGMPEQIVEASGSPVQRTTTIKWDATWHEPDTIIGPAGTQTSTFGYYSWGAPFSRTVTDTTTYTVPYSTSGQQRTWRTFMNSVGELTQASCPRWTSTTPANTVDSTVFTYNASGYLKSIANALGQTTTVTSWDWRGAPLSFTDPNGVVTNLTYDIHGRLLTSTVNPGAAQSEYQFAYDAVGDLTLVTLPMGATVQYAYDQGRRVTKVTDVRGETRTFTYDTNDDPLTLVTANSSGTTTQTHSATYDEWGRILQSIGSQSQTWNLAYDNLSNLLSVTDPPLGAPPGNERVYTYDALNRLATETDPSEPAISYAYNPADNLDKFTDARGLITSRVVDGFGEVIGETSPDRGTLTYWYDLSGNLVKQVDGDAIETDMAYDNANRIVSKTYPSDATENVAYTYDSGAFGIGRLAEVTEASGSTSFGYDAQGRILTDSKVVTDVSHSATLKVGYAYDANGKVIQITYPSGDVVNITRTTDGLVTAISQTLAGGSPANLFTLGVYEPFGPLMDFTDGGGIPLRRTFDEDYRLTQTEVANSSTTIFNVKFSWQHDGRIAGAQDVVNPTQGPNSYTATYGYTPAGRVQTGDGPWGDLSYAFDAAGNRTSSGASGALVTATVATASNQVTQTSQGGTVLRNLGYSPGGLLSTDQNVASGATFAFTYNAARRLTDVRASGVNSGEYGYDYKGQRVWRVQFSGGGSQTAYVYDEDGHLLAEHNLNGGAMQREYVWIDDMPIATVYLQSGSPVVGYVHTGQIDEPLAVTAANASLLWTGYVDPFGNGATFQTPTVTVDMRLPGQSFQAEADGFSQNHWRDYDPSLGRYAQPDPFGIDAGQNIYPYVDGDPLNRSDPMGLAGIPSAPPPNLPGGPYTPAGPGQQPGTFFGPKQLSGSRGICRWVPPEGEGGPPGSQGYWKTRHLIKAAGIGSTSRVSQ